QTTRRHRCRGSEAPLSVQQLLQSDRQLADALACCMEDRIGDGRSSPYIAELANAFDPGRVYASILFGNQNDLQLSYIGVNGDEVIGQIVVDVARRTLIQLGRFMQRRSDTPDHAAHQLATRRAGIDNMSSRKCATMRGTRISRLRAWTRTSTN